MIYSQSERQELILGKLRRSMTKDGLDALVAFRPENIFYSSGSATVFSYFMRTAGIAATIIPRDESKDPAAIVCDFEYPSFAENSWIKDIRLYPMWIFVDDAYEKGPSTANQEKGEQFGLAESFKLIQDILREKGIDKGKIGVEISCIQQPSWELLVKYLPDAALIDADNTWIDSRMIKMPWEIEQLRTAAAITEKGMASAVSVVQEGTTQKEIVQAFIKEIYSDDRTTGIMFVMARVGTHYAPRQFPSDHKAKQGDVISFDLGIDSYGYKSDMARTFSLGKPNENLKKIFPAIYGGYQLALDMVKPGVRMCDVFKASMDYIQKNGIPNYNRGNLGHQIGVKPTGQEPPLISPSETRSFEPGMVICLETPYYGYGVGAISIEDMILITEDGFEILTVSSKELIKL